MSAPGRVQSVLRLRATDLSHRWGPQQPPVLDCVGLDLHQGEVVGLVGRSGSGKSTLARCLAGLLQPSSASLSLNGQVLTAARTLPQRRAIQYVWQEPQCALSPYRSAMASAAEPLEGFGLADRLERPQRAAQMLQRMGLTRSDMQRLPHQLSGGQCQRVVLARALLAEPQVLLLDEPFSALDSVTTAALLQDLSQVLTEHRLAVLLVSHDRALVRRLAQRVLVLEQGQLRVVAD
ncbi:ABC transporter ATP-binding protein, partial [Serpentinimonas barnesii]|uniref:ABC transporter ATP-binding protein n=1 Tax=Serpentinimonas barnesii TaxID=1458427 RepID=UPI000495A0C0